VLELVVEVEMKEKSCGDNFFGEVKRKRNRNEKEMFI